MTDTNMSAKGFKNPGFVEESADKHTDHKVDKLADQIEATSTKAWLEQQLSQNAREVEIFDRTFMFRPVGTGVITDVVERAQGLGEEDSLGSMPDLFRDICEMLGEHCLDDEMNANEFAQLPPDMVQEVFQDVGVANMSAEQQAQVEKFRNE